MRRVTIPEKGAPVTMCRAGEGCSSRRDFLIAGGAAASVMALKALFPGRVAAADADLEVTLVRATRVKVAELDQLKVDKPVSFSYPPDQTFNEAQIIKLGRRAGGGIGPEQDIVAFSTWCTHMGGDLSDEYNAEHKVSGPCRQHLTTFDLTRHGMVAAGHATASLPQIVLELEGREIFATGMIGLLYGHHSNPLPATEGQAS